MGMGSNSPKRLRLGGNSGDFDAEHLMAPEASDRYAFAKTTRNRDNTVQGKYTHPPRLSPRVANKSVDPLVRKANMLSKGPMKTTGNFGPTHHSTLQKKKQSAPYFNQSGENQRMTSKYENFNVENPIEVHFDNGDPVVLGKKKGVKGIKSSTKKSMGRRSPSPNKEDAQGGEETQKSGSNNFDFSR